MTRLRARLAWLGLAAVVSALTAGALAVPAQARRSQAERAWIRTALARMSLPEEVGQLFEINGYGASVHDTDPAMVQLNRSYYGVDNIAQLIRKFHPGGFIYFSFSGNTDNPAQVAGLSNGIQRVALSQSPAVPMVISTDQEEGIVLRIGSPATVFPGNMPLGATRSADFAHQAALITGRELRAMGVNLDDAPVVDVNVNPLNQADGVRSYGDQVPLVTRLGVAQVRGYQDAQATRGVGATIKHWPGFGDSAINSDNGVASTPQTLSQVEHTNVPPFQAALKAGADRVMVAHLLFPRITGSRTPTSLSPFWVDGLLRRRLGYQGPVVTDALDAAALSRLTPGHVAVAALKAGDDELLEIAQTPTDKPPADLVFAYPAVLRAVRSGRISKARLDQSVVRILDLKWKLGLVRHPYVRQSNVARVVGTPEHLAVAQRIAADSITLVKNSAGLLPLAANSAEKVLVTGFGQVTTATLGQDLTAHGVVPTVMPTGSTPSSSAIAGAVSAAASSDLVLVTTYNAWGSPGQLNLVKALLATGKPVVVAAVGTPYDIAYFPQATTFVTSYGYQPVSLHQLVRVLFGELAPRGRLPVTITLYPFGYSLGSS